MKQLLLSALIFTCLALPFSLAINASESSRTKGNAPEGFTVIEEQPEGELRVYTRSGKVVEEIIEDTYNTTVTMGFDGDDVWLQGLYDMMPQTWLKGHRDGKTITFSTGQPLGSYLNKPAYLIGAQSDSEGNPVISDIVFTYDAANHTFAATSAVIAIGINKTGLLGLQNMYNATFTPDKAAGIETVCDPTASGQHPVYDLQGRRIDARHATSNKGILISNGKKVVLR